MRDEGPPSGPEPRGPAGEPVPPVASPLRPGLAVRRSPRFAWAGVALAAAFWLTETLLDAWAFDKGTFAARLLPGDPNEAWMRTLTALLLIAFGLGAQFAADRLRRAHEQEAALQREIDDARSRLLADFIPMCARCKAIRDGDKWVRVEQYVTQHTGSRFSHGLCPECLKEFEAEFRR